MSDSLERSEDDCGPAVRRLADWSPAQLRELAETYETPLYVLDLDRVARNYARFQRAFPDSSVYFAAKANTSRGALSTLAAAGAGVECASAGEVQRALDAGFDPDSLHYTAVNPPGRDLDHVVSLAAADPELTITAGARDTIDRLAERQYTGRLCLRVNPGVGAGHHDHVSTGADAKFGVAAEGAADLLADCQERGFEVVGIHAHAGSGISSAEELESHRELVSRMGELGRDVSIDLEFVDIGGGFGVPYHPEEAALDLDAVATATREALGHIDSNLLVEPGRYLVADAGVLLTEVNTVKSNTTPQIVGVDAGMTTLLRPMLYDAYHHVSSLAPDSPERESARVSVTGPVCESGDVLAADRELPAPDRGDLLAVGNAGAYGFEMASQYNSRPRPARVVLENGTPRLARQREPIADLRGVGLDD